MSVNSDSKRNNQRTLRDVLMFSAGMILIIAASGTGIPIVAAITEKTIDPGLGCGNNWWGVKASSLPESNMYWFGKKTDCTVDPARPTGYKNRTNVLFIHEFRPGDSSQQFAIEWQGAIQGKDPWGNNGSLNNGKAPKVANTNFPAPATPSSGSYNLKAQWLWTNDVKPLTDQINANFLTNLWFCKVDVNKNCPYTSDYMVIDFVWMQLKSTGNSGSWAQNIVSDADSSSPGTQVYVAYCESVKASDNIHNTNVYHYSIVLDNTSHGSNQWIEKISNVNQYITDAFNHSYPHGGAGGTCTHNIPDGATGHRSLFSITDQETGIELSAQNFGKSGRVEGGISNSDLYY